jgi:hypothetical protein
MAAWRRPDRDRIPASAAIKPGASGPAGARRMAMGELRRAEAREPFIAGVGDY